jgi:hypothetical protein
METEEPAISLRARTTPRVPQSQIAASRRGRRGSGHLRCETGRRAGGRSRPAVAGRAGSWVQAARLVRPGGRAAAPGRRFAMRPPRRDRHGRRLAHVGIGPPAAAGDRGAVHYLLPHRAPVGAAAHGRDAGRRFAIRPHAASVMPAAWRIDWIGPQAAAGDRGGVHQLAATQQASVHNRRSWARSQIAGPVGVAAADLVHLRCEAGPRRGWRLSARGRSAAAHGTGPPGSNGKTGSMGRRSRTPAPASVMRAARCASARPDKIRRGGKQVVVVQHVEVSGGGQAVIAGNMKGGTRGPKGGEERKNAK